jgi:hypothetical protein
MGLSTLCGLPRDTEHTLLIQCDLLNPTYCFNPICLNYQSTGRNLPALLTLPGLPTQNTCHTHRSQPIHPTRKHELLDLLTLPTRHIYFSHQIRPIHITL